MKSGCRRRKFEWKTTLSTKIRVKSVVLLELARLSRRFNYEDDVKRKALRRLM